MQGLPSLISAVAPDPLSSAAEVLGLLVAAALVLLFVRTVFRAPRSAYAGVWAFACLTTVVAAPHLLEYDLVFAVPALLYVLDRHDSSRVRWALLALVVLTWSGFPRHDLLVGQPWPITALGAAWGAVALLVLWVVLWRELELVRRTPEVAAPAEDPSARVHDGSESSSSRRDGEVARSGWWRCVGALASAPHSSSLLSPRGAEVPYWRLFQRRLALALGGRQRGPTSLERQDMTRPPTRKCWVGGLVMYVELRGLEPLTPSMRTRCATSCATAPCGDAQGSKP